MSPDTWYAHVFCCFCNVHAFICNAVILTFFPRAGHRLQGRPLPLLLLLFNIIIISSSSIRLNNSIAIFSYF